MAIIETKGYKGDTGYKVFTVRLDTNSIEIRWNRANYEQLLSEDMKMLDKEALATALGMRLLNYIDKGE